jgi:putative proteasome-type protease
MTQAVVVGKAIREVKQRDEAALNSSNIDFNCNFIFGGQIRGREASIV